jgi:hypothetical protein
MTHQDDVREDALDAIALLTDSYSDEPAFEGKLLFKVAGSGGDVEVVSKLLGLVGGMAVVAKMLLEYCLEAVGDEDDDGLTDLASGFGNTTIQRHLREMTEVARKFVDYTAQESGLSRDEVLARLGEDMNLWLDE